MNKWILWLRVSLAALVLLCGCGSLTTAAASPGDVPAVASVAPLEQPAGAPVVQSTYAGKKLGIIGQSFISANGADNSTLLNQDTDSYQPGTTGPQNLCFRSLHAAGVQAAQQLGMAYVFAACAGAEPTNLYKTPQYNEGVQVDWLTPDMSGVVMGGRGNPEFGQVIQQILNPAKDPLLLCSPLAMSPQQRNDCVAGILQWAVTAYENRTPEEQAIYDSIQARAPNAQVYAMGIPPVVPKPGDDISVCSWFLSPEEVAPLYNMVVSLNAMIKDLAAKNGAIFVDMNRPDSPWMQGRHDLCAPAGQAWVWGPRLLIPPNSAEAANPEMWATGSFHPTIAANDAMGWVLRQTMLEHQPAA